jgi:ABC-type nitrate/sulfonate/bicarbonate transport system permease component
MNRTDRLTRRTSPELDPVVLVCTIVTIALLLLAGWKLASDVHTTTPIFCPAPDHPVWASTLQQWICGDSFAGGFKTVKSR